jgi:secreted PhoX family phosphatase
VDSDRRRLEQCRRLCRHGQQPDALRRPEDRRDSPLHGRADWCEVTGISFSPDQKTLFVGIQHPGENGGSTFPEHLPNGKPRSSVMAITREDGGIVGA